MLAFVLFSLLRSILILVEYTGPGSRDHATDQNMHLVAYQALANIAFTVGAALALAGLLDRLPGRSWRLVMGAAVAAAAGFVLLFVEAQTVPPLFGGVGS